MPKFCDFRFSVSFDIWDLLPDDGCVVRFAGDVDVLVSARVTVCPQKVNVVARTVASAKEARLFTRSEAT